MNISDMLVTKVRDLPPSGIRKYFDLLNEMKDAISLGVGEPDFVTPWSVRQEGIVSLEKGHTHYSPNAGYTDLRKEISNYMKRKYDLTYNSNDEVIVTVGASEGIDLALRALVTEGDEVVFPEPSFVAYMGCIRLTGAKPIVVELKEENDFRITAKQLENAITEKTKVVILPFPNNPTGAILEEKDLKEIVEVLKDKNLIIISDEIYSELTYGQKHISIASFDEVKEKTIVINGFSKAYAMTGWRLGYACGNPIIIEAMKKIHQYAIMCAPTTAQYAAKEALRNCDEDVEKMVMEYNRRRKIMVDGLNRIGLKCFEPRGAFYVFPSIESTGISSDEFCERLLKEYKVLMVPGGAFGKCAEGFVRATYANSMENIIEALKRIEAFVNSISFKK